MAWFECHRPETQRRHSRMMRACTCIHNVCVRRVVCMVQSLWLEEKNKQLIVQLAKQLNNRSDSARTCNTCEQQSNNGKGRLQRIESVNSASILSGDNVDNCASKKSWADRTAKRHTSQSKSCDEIVGDDGFQVVRSKKRKNRQPLHNWHPQNLRQNQLQNK
ncbi:hypothetical protein HELRODRAFT_179477 [Helobdella robusta]|uniref:Uncharacterized protein n=1 Tax=Helobdella robusta TaxID=6412 RepID=T1FER7_HELRO|nr:hypothetical protein HELRODRAFT_179477 [Helobdella robusta]ESN95403.1 hypothetical protein HELRODRAFT_179477 [Helobdella robusta]